MLAKAFRQRFAVATLVVVLASSVFVLMSGVATPNAFCELSAPLAPSPPGWHWGRDHNCEMTLFDEDGNRAPDELYRGTLVPPPPQPPMPLGERIAFVGLAFSGLGLAVASGVCIARHTRHTRNPSPHSIHA